MTRNILKTGISAAMLSAVSLFAGCAYDDGGIPAPSTVPGGTSGGYKVSVGTVSTRVQLDGITYLWTPGDHVGFYIADAGASSVVASNVRLKSMNTVAAPSAEFQGEISESQITRIAAAGSYDYYSYYPYSANTGGTFPNMNFSIPAEQSRAAGSVDVPVFMTARAGGRGALTYLLPDGRQAYTGNKVDFAFGHAMSYMDIYLALNLMSQRIVKITVTDTSGGSLAGTASVDLKNGSVTPVAGSSRIVVSIPGGMDVHSPDVRVAVMPRTFGPGAKLKFTLESEYGNIFETEADVGGKSFEAGRNHRIGLRTSYNFSFEGSGRNDEKGAFTYKGYYFWGDSSLKSNDYSIYFNRGFNGGNGTFRLQLNVANTSGLGSVPVKVTLTGKRNGTTEKSRNLEYAAIASDATGFSGPYVEIYYNTNITGNTGFGDSGPFYLNLSESTPCIGLRSVMGTFIGIPESTYIFIRSIKVEPNY